MAWRRSNPSAPKKDDPVVVSHETMALLDHLTGRIGGFTDRLEEIARHEEVRQEHRKRSGGS